MTITDVSFDSHRISARIIGATYDNAVIMNHAHKLHPFLPPLSTMKHWVPFSVIVTEHADELTSENDLVIILALFPRAVVMSQTCYPQPGEEDDEHDYCYVGMRHGFVLVVEAVCRRDVARTGTVDHATSPLSFS